MSNNNTFKLHIAFEAAIKREYSIDALNAPERIPN